jgi:hypothetical protein
VNQPFKKPRVFVSHSSADKSFVEELAMALRHFRFDVWYDDWEIAVGDSIVGKVFAGLDQSDALLVVLSRASVTSRWVKEELNVAVMRRLSANDIRILPLLVETCDVPTPLKHLHYADFRKNVPSAMSRLLDSLVPGYLMWQSLEISNDHFRLLCDEITQSPLDTDFGDKLIQLHSLLESALNLRTEIEFRRSQQKMDDLSFFEKIGALAEKGVDVRSQTWNALVHYRAAVAHRMKSDEAHLRMFTHMLRDRYEHMVSDPSAVDMREWLSQGLERLQKIMHRLCFETWDSPRH